MRISSYNLPGSQEGGGTAPRLRCYAAFAGVAVAALGAMVLFGWALDVPVLKSVLPHWVAMKANAALGFLLVGLSLLLQRREGVGGRVRRIGQLCALLAILLGLATLAQYGFDWDLGIDNAVFVESGEAVQTSFPGRMAPGTAFAFLFLGLALLLLDMGTHCPAHALAIPPLVLSLLALLGYLYGAQPLFHPVEGTAMALHTAAGIAMAGTGILCARPERGWMALLSAPTSGGATIRRLAPVVLVLVPLLFRLQQSGERAGFYDSGFGIALMVLASMILLSVVVIWNAATLNRTEAALRQQERRLSMLMGNLPGMAYRCRCETSRTMLFASAGAFGLTGHNPEALVGDRDAAYGDLIHPDDRACMWDRVRASLDTGESFQATYRLLAADGEERWVLDKGSAVPGEAGTPAVLEGFVIDVTDRHRAEHALRESERKLLEAKRLAGLGNWEWNVRTGVHAWSEEIYRIYGRDPALPPAAYPEVQEYFAPESWARLSAAVEEALAAGCSYECDAEVVQGKDGPRRWITARGEAELSPAGEVVGLHGTVQDITDRKRTEERLHALNRRLEVLQKAIARLAAARNTEEVMEVARTAARGLTGADGASFVLRDGDQCFYADEDAVEPLWKGRRFPIERCISGWAMLHHETVAVEDVFADPRVPAEAYRPTFVKSLAVVPIRAVEPLGAIGCYWSVRHRATEDELGLLRSLADGVAVAMENVLSYSLLEQRVLERTAELRAANQELDAFAYAVSHDLRAPLRAMSGFSQALVEDFGESLPAGAREFLDEIVLASRRMGELVDGLLGLSRGTRGELQRENVDLSLLAERILRGLAAAEPSRQVEWSVEPGLSARGDARMIEAMLENLLGNAWKYTAAVPQATIRFYAEQAGGIPEFCVADNGAGFDMRHAGKLFQPFQRLHRQDEFPGIGIGLATAQRILHRHGGAIRAEAEPGRGATFRFTLPGDGTEPKECGI